MKPTGSLLTKLALFSVHIPKMKIQKISEPQISSFKIYLIVDDLGRCDEEYKAKMFKVIRESTQLTNCKTIFLADRKSFFNEICDNNYFEKYISYNLELCLVKYEEIVHYYFDIIFNDYYISSIQRQIWHGRDSYMLRKELLNLSGQIVSALTKEKSE